ncbi:MAG: MoxR family ATPase, partial [Pirellulales bacterium]|nr:MoxR family ATPase [Pirellulales bacterium]
TQNPIEQEGTYPLPEAQRDRFLLHVKVKYPTRAQEKQIIEQTTGSFDDRIRPVLTGQHIIACQRIVRKVPVPDHVLEYVLDLVRKSRPEEDEALAEVRQYVQWGPGPRAAQCLVMGGKVRALLKGRYHVTVDDIQSLAHPVLRHRIVPTFAAESQGMTVDHIITQIVDAISQGKGMQLI